MSNKIIFKIEDHEFVVEEFRGEWFNEFEIGRIVGFDGLVMCKFTEKQIESGFISTGFDSSPYAHPHQEELEKYLHLYRVALKKYIKYNELRAFE